MTKRTQPAWSLPSSTSSPKLHLFNSLTRDKREFIPINGKSVLWYNCGPTVYDVSHMGHARSYISFDIIRRVLKDYFNYDVFFVQNVTDIDDKIIRRARQLYIFNEYLVKIKNVEPNLQRQQLNQDIMAALALVREKFEIESDIDKKSFLEKLINNTEECLKSPADNDSVAKGSKDVLSEWLDRQHGHSVTDNSIFSSLPKKFEDEYNKDMANLNVLPPDAVTRVSEFVPEIIEYIQQIILNGYAYESQGSIYFDVDKFNNQERHFYAKLVPEAFGDCKALAEGEGDLSCFSDKRSANDFALWKSSKPGEPWWDSPWGKGRPGWHIECSVMANALLGGHIDIHSGGVDLKFPHHDNEIAQSEAYEDNGTLWVNYFLHSGHLTISGCKMSKSLKNFISIKDALEENSARQLRLAFLLHSWKDTLDYGPSTMADAKSYEKTLNEFFLNIKDAIRTIDNLDKKWQQEDKELNNKFRDCISGVDFALCDNIDTKTACDHIKKLISFTNTYLQDVKSSNGSLLNNIALYVTNIFKTFGATAGESTLGFTDYSAETTNEKSVMPYLEIIANFREKVRQYAKDLKHGDLLKLCDHLRDEILPDQGVRLEDRQTGDGSFRTSIKLVDREVLMKEREEKLRVEKEKQREKERQRLEKLKKEQEKEAQMKIRPREMFKDGLYSLFNEKGIPTHDKEGKELTKSQVKKLEKLYEKQEKLYKTYCKENGISNEINL